MFKKRNVTVCAPEVQIMKTACFCKQKASGHPHIVELVDVYLGEETTLEKGKLVFNMELCDRNDLAYFINHYAYVHVSDATLWMLHMCTGLGHLRSHSIMHRDIKPGNCLLFHQTTWSPMLKLSDCGAAVVLARKGGKGPPSQSLSQDLTAFRYAASEVVRRESYEFVSADAWGIGVICWEMLQSDPREVAVGIDDRYGYGAIVRTVAVCCFQIVVFFLMLLICLFLFF